MKMGSARVSRAAGGVPPPAACQRKAALFDIGNGAGWFVAGRRERHARGVRSPAIQSLRSGEVNHVSP